jgi:hypothetical protein
MDPEVKQQVESAKQQVESAMPAQPETGEAGGEEAAEQGQRALARFGEVMKRPAVGASIAGGLVLGAAAAFGVLEAAIAAGAAYAAYLALRRKRASEQGAARSPSQ